MGWLSGFLYQPYFFHLSAQNKSMDANLCKLTEDDENGGLRFEIDKHRVSIRLTAPYSEERKTAASQQAAMNTPFSSIYSS